jgi:hypothetical protein
MHVFPGKGAQLFSGHPLSTVLEVRRSEALEAAQSVPPEQLADPALFARALGTVRDRFTLAPLELELDRVYFTDREIQVDVSRDPDRRIMNRRQPFHRPGTEVTYHVPFRGERWLFDCTPSTHLSVMPFGRVEGREYLLTLSLVDGEIALLRQEYEEQLSRLTRYVEFQKAEIAAFNSALPTVVAVELSSSNERRRQREQRLGALGVPRRETIVYPLPPVVEPPTEPSTASAPEPPPTRSTRAKSTVKKSASGAAKKGKRSPSQSAQTYDVALSFAGEDRGYVDSVAKALQARGVSVFYDGFEEATLWGTNLLDHLGEIYARRSRFVVLFVSKHYASKAWPNHERQSALAGAFTRQDRIVLTARFDDTEIPGVLPTVHYIDLRTRSPEQLAELVQQKLAAVK